MDLSLIVLVSCLVAIVVFALKARLSGKAEGLFFETRGYLFTPAERSFLGVLEQALDSHLRVFGKVRLGDIIKPAKGLSRSKRATALNKINQKHVDFVICSAADLAVFGVVELDDQSHGREDRAGRDEFVDLALAGAKIPVIRFSAKKGYAIQDVRAKLIEAFNLAAESPVLTVAKEEPSPAQPETKSTADSMLAQPDEVAPGCPKCAATMVKRQAKNGPHASKLFWACSTYPNCRQVVAIERQ